MPAPPALTQRLWALDALRGIAVVLMIQQHLGMWFTRLQDLRGGVGRLLVLLNLTGGLAAPLFVVLAGFGVALDARAREHSGQTRGAAELALRGAALFAVGAALNLLTPKWFSPVSFYVLHLLGVWLCLAPGARRLPDAALASVALLLLALGPLAQTALDTPLALTNAQMNAANSFEGALLLACFEGHFPLVPWLFFALTGFGVARRALNDEPRRALGIACCVLLGGALVRALSLVPALSARSARSMGGDAAAFGEQGVRVLRRVWAFSFYPATTSFVLLLTGLACLLALAALLLGRAPRADEERPSDRPRFGFVHLVHLGRTSLTWMVVHVVLFRQYLAPDDARHRLTPTVTLAVIGASLVLFALLARLWSRWDYKFSLEWSVRRIGSWGRRRTA